MEMMNFRMPLLSQVLLGSFGLSQLKWLQNRTAVQDTIAAVRHELAPSSTAGCILWHFNKRKPPWLHDLLVLLSFGCLRKAGRIASPVLNHWLYTGIAFLCVLEYALPAASCLLPVPVGESIGRKAWLCLRTSE